MYSFVAIFLIALILASGVGLAWGFRVLKSEKDLIQRQHTAASILVSFVGILLAVIALAGLLTKAVDPVVALLITLMMLVLAKLGLRHTGKQK